MSIKRVSTLVLAAASLLAMGTVPALANRMVTFTVSGLVTVAPSGGQITVDGRTYRIGPQSDAALQAASVHRGDRVELTLDGPATADSSIVVEIHASSNTGR